MQFDDGLDLDGDVGRQRSQPDRGPVALTGFAERDHEQVGKAVDDVGVVGEIIGRVDQASDLQYLLDPRKLAERRPCYSVRSRPTLPMVNLSPHSPCLERQMFPEPWW